MQVLIIDDDVVSRMVLMHLVDTAGSADGDCGGLGAAGSVDFDVLEAEDGEQAWQLLQAGARPAMLFCDLRMPRLSGMELLARMRADARFAKLPFVLVSAAADSATMEQAMALGADGYIVKPFDSARVCAHLARLALPSARGEEGAAALATFDEEPGATARRLGIDGARLLLYLGGLQRQLDAAAAELAPMLADGHAGAVYERLARLAEGCRMLGLDGAAAGLAALQARLAPGTVEMKAAAADAASNAVDESTPQALSAALDAARAAVLRQTVAARRLPA
ncbi:response regulator [Massilia forsythiae]|uniref:Response regulator n=1 Tax=Massilia forsythiae TaxID=2728020 RepID=A0A7Z2ZQU7_9BURK|nr:response regulator [Massilia forsythiae]QJD98795.1 response regulator [Massilia forsythiae]